MACSTSLVHVRSAESNPIVTRHDPSSGLVRMKETWDELPGLCSDICKHSCVQF
jgi:hypothetical protein